MTRVVAPLAIALVSACSPSTRPLISGTGLHLDDTDKGGSGIAYRDLGGALFFATTDGDTNKIADATTSSKFAGGALTIWFGLDATQTIATSMKVRTHDGSVVDAGKNVDTTSLHGAPDGSAMSFEAAGSATGTIDVVLVNTSGVRALFVDAVKAKESWSATGDVLVVGAKFVDAATSATTKTVKAYDANGDHVVCADGCARAVAVTNDGTRALFFGNDANNAGTLELVDVAGGTPQVLAPSVSDQALKLNELDPTGARAYFLGANGAILSIALSGTSARALKQSGAVDLVDVRNGFVVYASSIDVTTNLATLGIAREGADVTLGTNAIGEGFSSDARFYVFRDGVSTDAKGHAFGRLRAFDTTTSTTRTLAVDVRKAQVVGDAVVWLDETKHLRRARLDRGSPELVQINVDTFDVAGRDTATPRIVYSIPADVNAGVWLADP